MALNESCLEIYKGLFCYPKTSCLFYQKANQQLNNIKKFNDTITMQFRIIYDGS